MVLKIPKLNLLTSSSGLTDLHDKKVGVACLQETKLSSRAGNFSFPNYNLVCRDRPVGGGGGLAFLIHHSIPFTHVDTPFILDQTIDQPAVA